MRSSIIAESTSRRGTGLLAALIVTALDMNLNGDRKPDLAWQDNGVSGWMLDGTQILGKRSVTCSNCSASQIVGSGDFSGDFRPDILTHNISTGMVVATLTNGSGVSSGTVDLSMRCGPAPRAATETDPQKDGGPGCAAAWRPVGMLSPARF